MKAEQLADLAASVADGTPVDWKAAELRGTIAERRLLGHLRLVESIANLHKSIAPDRPLADLAASVADGAPVDWKAAEHQISPAERRFLRHLQIVENISTLHRTTPESESAGAAAPIAEPTGPRWGRLVLLDRIGEGMSCEVYRAWDTELHRHVALKLLHDEGNRRDAHSRILEEARRLARVRHAHVVQVYGAEQHDHRVGLWMELVQGESLEQILRARGPFGAREAAAIGLDLCAALAAVHGAHLLHRDLKAHNVMRESGGRIVLMDFGTGEELTGTNRLVGTPLYLAPEIFHGQAASVQSDLYSVGVLLFYLATGKYPVNASSMEMLAKAHERRQRTPLRDLRPDLPEPFVRAVEQALQNDPQHRYRTAGEMEAALRTSLAPQAVPVEVEQRAATDDAGTGTTERRRPLGRILAAAAVLVLIATALIVWTRIANQNRGATLAAVRTVAILPMTLLPGSSIPEHFPAALTDELLSILGEARVLTVKSAASSGSADDRQRAALAHELDVDALLETTLLDDNSRGAGSPQIRVNARLLAAGTQAVVWSRSFSRPRGETLALPADIAREIAKAMNAAVTEPEAARLATVRQTNPAAEDAYLLGKVQLNGYGIGSAERALKAFDRALQIDDKHARAHAAAAWAHIGLGQNGAVSHGQAHASSLLAVRRALELDPGLADAHATLGYIHFLYEWDWKAAEAEFRQGIQLNPSSAYAHRLYVNYLEAFGRFDQAIEQARTAGRLDPESGYMARRLALVLYYKKDFAAAEQSLKEVRGLEPNAAGTYILQGRIDEAFGRFDQALDATKRAIDLSSGGGVPLKVQVIRLEALSGRRADALAHLEELQREAEGRRIRLSARDMAYVQLALGDRNRALEYFAQAVDDHDPSMVWLGVDPRVDELRGEPQFRALLARMRLPAGP